MSTKQDDIQTLKTDVALIKLEQKTQGKTLATINGKLDNLGFVSQKDHDRDIHDIRKEIEDAKEELRAEYTPTVTQVGKDTKLVNAGGLKNVNAVFGSVAKILISALSLGIVIIIVVAVLLSFPAIKGALT